MATSTRTFYTDLTVEYDEGGIEPTSYHKIASLCGTEGAEWMMGPFRGRMPDPAAPGQSITQFFLGLFCATSNLEAVVGFERMKTTMVRIEMVDGEEITEPEGREEESWTHTPEDLMVGRRELARGFVRRARDPRRGEVISFRLLMTVEIVCKLPDVPPPMPTLLAGYTDINTSPHPTDVQFHFASLPLVLYANADSLIKSCPHFESMFGSGFAKCTMIDHVDSEEAKERELERDFDDSDNETDEMSAQQSTSKSGGSTRPFRRIDITGEAYTTYRAVLCYLQTGHITFAPLRSNFRFLLDPISSRRQAIETLHFDPTHPVPASPKSVYRLAGFLLLPDLAALALASLKSQLTTSNIAYELHGDVAAVHDEVAEMELDFATSNWKKAGKSAAMQQVRKIAKGEMVGWAGMSSSENSAEMSIRLAERLSER